eukprot:gene813-883_t
MEHQIDCSASTPRCTKCGASRFERPCPYVSGLVEAEQVKAEVERMKVGVERVKVGAEQVKAEAECKKADAERLKAVAVFAGIVVAFLFIALLGFTFQEVSQSVGNIKVALTDISNSVMIAAGECRKGGIFGLINLVKRWTQHKSK